MDIGWRPVKCHLLSANSRDTPGMAHIAYLLQHRATCGCTRQSTANTWMPVYKTYLRWILCGHGRYPTCSIHLNSAPQVAGRGAHNSPALSDAADDRAAVHGGMKMIKRETIRQTIRWAVY